MELFTLGKQISLKTGKMEGKNLKAEKRKKIEKGKRTSKEIKQLLKRSRSIDQNYSIVSLYLRV